MTFLTADTYDDVEPLARLLVKQGDVFWGFLQIAIHYHMPASPGVINARSQRVALAKATAELDASNPRIFMTQHLNKQPCVVGTSIVHEYNGEAVGDGRQSGYQPPAQFTEKGLALVHRDDNSNFVRQAVVALAISQPGYH